MAILGLFASPTQAKEDQDWHGLASAAASDVTQQPLNAKLLNRYGYYQYRAGVTDEAFNAYQRSLAIEPSYAVAWNNLGVLYLANEQYSEAQEAFEQALRHDEDYARAQFNLAVANFRQGSYYRALRLYLSVRRSNPEYVESRSDEEMAQDEFERALRESPNDPVLRAVQRRLERENRAQDRRNAHSPFPGHYD